MLKKITIMEKEKTAEGICTDFLREVMSIDLGRARRVMEELEEKQRKENRLPHSMVFPREKLQKLTANLDPDFVEIFTKYSKYTNGLSSPTLEDVKRAFSEESLLFWLRYHISETLYFCAIYDKESVARMKETARLMLFDVDLSKVTMNNVLRFLTEIKCCRYGKIEFCKDILIHWRNFIVTNTTNK